MGWDGIYTSLRTEELVRQELTRNGNYRVLDHHGAKYWIVEHTSVPDTVNGMRFAVVVHSRRDRAKGMTWLKFVDESSGPTDAAMPMRMLRLIEDRPAEGYAASFRARVRAYHEQRALRRKAKRN